MKLFGLITAFSLIFVLAGCNETGSQKKIDVKLLSDSVSKLNRIIDSLTKSTNPLGGEMLYWQNSRNLLHLKNSGIQNPAVYISNDLSSHTGLIKYKPVLGGNFMFGRITLLGENWAIARFEDGHLSGEMLLKYKLSKENRIQWTVLDQFLIE